MVFLKHTCRYSTLNLLNQNFWVGAEQAVYYICKDLDPKYIKNDEMYLDNEWMPWFAGKCLTVAQKKKKKIVGFTSFFGVHTPIMVSFKLLKWYC